MFILISYDVCSPLCTATFSNEFTRKLFDLSFDTVALNPSCGVQLINIFRAGGVGSLQEEEEKGDVSFLFIFFG